MKTLFDIHSGRELRNEHTLLLEVGRDFCSYAFWHQPSNTIDRLRFISFDALEMETHLVAIVHSLNGETFTQVVVCSAFPEALLVPRKHYQQDATFLDLIYEQPAHHSLHDPIPEWQMVTAYSLPRIVYDTINASFGGARFLHAYTPAIKVNNGVSADKQLSVHFTAQHFRVLLKKDNAIYLAQTYYYKSPMDVVYYLLKICYEFQVPQQEVALVLSGLVEKDSQMFRELQQYFLDVHFAHPPLVNLPEEQHPHYFFTSIYNLAACVS